MILHIVNGDCALNPWLQCGFDGEVLVWRENYLQGVIPATCDLTRFNRIRAEELHRIAPQKSAAEIFADLQDMHHRLLSLTSADKLVLWLDCCPFDQALKKRLLELIAAMTEKPELYLIQQDVVWNRDAFKRYADWQEHAIKKLP